MGVSRVGASDASVGDWFIGRYDIGRVKWLEERDLIWRDDANILRQVDPLMARYLKSL